MRVRGRRIGTFAVSQSANVPMRVRGRPIGTFAAVSVAISANAVTLPAHHAAGVPRAPPRRPWLPTATVSPMNEELSREVANLAQALADLADRVNTLVANLHGPTATRPAGADVDATLAR